MELLLLPLRCDHLSVRIGADVKPVGQKHAQPEATGAEEKDPSRRHSPLATPDLHRMIQLSVLQLG